MTVLGGLVRRSWENPAVPLTSASLLEYFGGGRSRAGVQVSEQRALGLSAYYRGIALIAGTLAGLPLRVYQKGTRTKVTKRTVLDKPNPLQTAFEFWQTMYANAVSWGNGYGLKVRDGSRAVVRVWPLHPSAVKVTVDSETFDLPVKVFTVTDAKGRQHVLTDWEVFHLPYLSLHGYVGLSPLKLAREVLGVAIAAEDYSAGFFGNGTHLSGILKTPQKLDEPKAKRLKAAWREKLGGVDHAHDIAVLDAGAEFQALSIPPEDAQLLQTRQFSVNEIGRLLGVPPFLLGDMEKSTSWGSGIEQQMLGWKQTSLGSWISLGEQRTTSELLPGGDEGPWYAELALEGFLRGDSTSRAGFYKAGILDGWLRRNEVRAFENLEPAEGLDEFIVPANMTLITADGTPIPLSTIGAGTSGGGQAADGSAAAEARAIAELIQKIYLGVGVVVSAEEAREIANRAGAGLDVPGPDGLGPRGSGV